MLGGKIILDIHDLVPEFYQRKFNIDAKHPIVRILRIIEKIAAHYADHVITVTTIWQDTLIKRSVSGDKCSVILNSPDPRLFFRHLTRKKHNNSHFHMIYHGNLSEIFGVDIAIKAMKIVREQIPHAELHIYGQGGNKLELMKLARNCCIDDSIVFHDPVSRNIIPEILHSADVGIDPKRDGVLAGEGLSSKCMEYLAVGLPAVVSRIRAAQTYYDDSMVAFFEPGNENDLAKNIIDLYRHPQKRKALIQHSNQFNKEHAWHRYENIYFNLLNDLESNSERKVLS